MMPLGLTSLGSISLGSISLGSISLGSTSLGSTSLGSTSLGTASLGATSSCDSMLSNALGDMSRGRVGLRLLPVWICEPIVQTRARYDGKLYLDTLPNMVASVSLNVLESAGVRR